MSTTPTSLITGSGAGSVCPLCGTDCSHIIARAVPVDPWSDEPMPERMYRVEEEVIEDGVTRYSPGQLVTLQEAIRAGLPGAQSQAAVPSPVQERAVQPSQDRAVHPGQDR